MASDFASRLHKRLLINIDKVKSSSEAPIWKKLRYRNIRFECIDGSLTWNAIYLRPAVSQGVWDSICGAQFPGERIELLLPEFDKDSVTAMLRLLTCGEASGAPAAAALELMAALGADLTQFEVEGGAGLGGGDPPTEEVENREDPSPPPPHEGGDPLQVDQAVGTEQVPPGHSGGDLEATVGGTVEGGEEESSTGEGLQCFACDTALGSGEDLLTHLSIVHFRASLLDDCGGGDRLRCHKCGEEFGEEDGLLRHFGVAHAVAVKYVPGEQKEKHPDLELLQERYQRDRDLVFQDENDESLSHQQCSSNTRAGIIPNQTSRNNPSSSKRAHPGFSSSFHTDGPPPPKKITAGMTDKGGSPPPLTRCRHFSHPLLSKDFLLKDFRWTAAGADEAGKFYKSKNPPFPPDVRARKGRRSHNAPVTCNRPFYRLGIIEALARSAIETPDRDGLPSITCTLPRGKALVVKADGAFVSSPGGRTCWRPEAPPFRQFRCTLRQKTAPKYAVSKSNSMEDFKAYEVLLHDDGYFYPRRREAGGAVDPRTHFVARVTTAVLHCPDWEEETCVRLGWVERAHDWPERPPPEYLGRLFLFLDEREGGCSPFDLDQHEDGCRCGNKRETALKVWSRAADQCTQVLMVQADRDQYNCFRTIRREEAEN